LSEAKSQKSSEENYCLDIRIRQQWNYFCSFVTFPSNKKSSNRKAEMAAVCARKNDHCDVRPKNQKAIQQKCGE